MLEESHAKFEKMDRLSLSWTRESGNKAAITYPDGPGQSPTGNGPPIFLFV